MLLSLHRVVKETGPVSGVTVDDQHHEDVEMKAVMQADATRADERAGEMRRMERAAGLEEELAWHRGVVHEKSAPALHQGERRDCIPVRIDERESDGRSGGD